MTMNFRTVQDALISVLGTYANDQFRVCGYHNKPEDTANIRNSNASVAVYCSKLEYPRGRASVTGPYRCDATYQIEIQISTSARADLETLNSVEATQAQKSTAMTNIQNTRLLADQALNTLYDAVFQILMHGERADLGLEAGTIAYRWINSAEKGEPGYSGDLLVSTMTLPYTCIFEETVSGETPTDLEEINLTLNLNSEPGDGQAGINQSYVSE